MKQRKALYIPSVTTYPTTTILADGCSRSKVSLEANIMLLKHDLVMGNQRAKHNHQSAQVKTTQHQKLEPNE